MGPIAGGIIAIVVATILSRGGLLIPALLGVGSWWLYKFWPRKAVPDDARARAFLDRLESSPPGHDQPPTPSDNATSGQSLDEFRQIRL
jgi:hypothetical protein